MCSAYIEVPCKFTWVQNDVLNRKTHALGRGNCVVGTPPLKTVWNFEGGISRWNAFARRKNANAAEKRTGGIEVRITEAGYA